MMGGTINGIGNVTAAAEYNMHFDSTSARLVFQSPVTKVLIPLDVTRLVKFTLDFIDRLPSEATRVGVFVRRVLPFLYRAFHQHIGQESIYLHDVVTLVSVLEPELFQFAEMAGDVETRGELTLGATVIDRRPNPRWRPNMDVAVQLDVEKVIGCVNNSLALAGAATSLDG